MPDRELIDIEQPPITERAVLGALQLPHESEETVEERLDELQQLAATAGAETVLISVQARQQPNPSAYFGFGKLNELRLAVEETAADVFIVDGDITGSQQRKLEDVLECKVVDRTQLILDIFAQRAQTREGKLQVELAQLQYLLPRLAGRGRVMRQQGGIGVRGPGEQKLEVDRRRIRDRISRLKDELEGVRRSRETQRKQRREQAEALVALVGYTNAGKSSLLNALTDAGVRAEDKLFATLDPRIRRCDLPSGRQILLADTVGFVRNLPHTLVAAFRATLEEVNQADLLLIVADASHPAMEEHLKAVLGVLKEIGAAEIPRVHVYNKADRISEGLREQLASKRHPSRIVSAHTGEGLEELLGLMDARVGETRLRALFRVPQTEGGVVNEIHDAGRVLEQRYEDNAVLLHAEVTPQLRGRLAEYVVEDTA